MDNSITGILKEGYCSNEDALQPTFPASHPHRAMYRSTLHLYFTQSMYEACSQWQ